MSSFQNSHNVLDFFALCAQEDDDVVQQIRSLVEEERIVVVLGFDDEFHSFFAHFFGDFVDALAEEFCGVTTNRTLLIAFVDEFLEVRQEADVALLKIKTRGRSLVASGAVGLSLDEDGVVVAIHIHLFEVQEVAGSFALSPKAIATARPKSYLLGFLSFLETLLVHISEHQHLQCLVILYNGRNQPAHFFKIQCHFSKTIINVNH